ncbi:MAG: hypothetical protein IJ887_12950 [Prevotella sp.]|nr:hypothetical protein [Prevotella sp.]
MKKIYFLLLTAIAVASCNDDCNHGFDINPVLDIVGSWYEETQNEEDTYGPTGTFYGHYCNLRTQGEGEGIYRIDAAKNRKTESFHVNGMGMTYDWKLRDVSKYQFTEYSDEAILTYGKVVETHEMKGGDTQKIAFNELDVQGYESTNEFIATVSPDGTITTTGEKGIVYIKIKTGVGNVYAKVIVDNNMPDLWADYSGLLEGTFDDMKALLGEPDRSSESPAGTMHVYVTDLHNIMRGLRVDVSPVSRRIDQIDLIIRPGVTLDKLTSYMKAHYYRFAEDGTQIYYSTSPSLGESRAVYALETDTVKVGNGSRAVFMMTEEEFERLSGSSLFPTYKYFFGLDKQQTKAKAEKKGWTLLQEFDDVYSENGSVAYNFEGYDYTNAIELVYNTENLVSQCVVYMSPSTPDREILAYLGDNFMAADNEKTTRKWVYYNAGKTQKAEFDILSKTLYFTDLTMSPFEEVILGPYWKIIGMTKEQIVSAFGEPLVEDETGYYLRYAPFTDVIYYFNVMIDETSGKAVQINMQLQDKVDDDTIIAYLNKKYYYHEKNNTDQGPRIRWYNAEKIEDATLRATYYPDYNMMVYAKPE